MENQIQKHKPNLYQMISDKSSKIELIEHFGAMTLKQVVKEQPPAIGALERQHGKEAISNAIAVIVSDLNQSFGGDIGKDDILEVVAEVRTGITRSISLEDIYLICQKIKTSSTYKLKVPTILKAVNDHLAEKSNMVMNENYNKHLAGKFEGERSSTDYRDDDGYKKAKIEYLTKQAMK